jgi:B12-binding domain/radical SAM domain protein
MKIALISPAFYTYGAMIIGGVLRDHGYHVRITRDLRAEEGELVVLSLYSTMHLLDERIKSFIESKKAAGSTCIVGGPVSAYPEMVLGELAPDVVVLGEGEDIILRLVEEGVHDRLPGIAYQEGTILHLNPPDHLPSVEHPLPLIPDDIGEQNIRGASAYIETHRGCTGACTFCQVPRFFGRRIRSRSIDAILSEVREFKSKGAKRISISGGTGSLYQFTDGRLNEDAFINLLAGIAGIMGPKNVSAPDIRVDCITDGILNAIKQYTIGWLFFGIESGSDGILREMGKGVTVRQMSEAITRSREHGLKVAGSFIVGYPTETEDDYQKTKKFIAEHGLDDVFISIAEPIPKTPLGDLAVRTPEEKNPTFTPHRGEYRALNLTESEARCFDLMMHADMYKPLLHVVTDDIFNLYLTDVRKQGHSIQRVTKLLCRYTREGNET